MIRESLREKVRRGAGNADDAQVLLAELEQAEQREEGERTRVKFLEQVVEQAERERDEARTLMVEESDAANVYAQRTADAEARLAKVPALVEDAKREGHRANGNVACFVCRFLAVWEQE